MTATGATTLTVLGQAINVPSTAVFEGFTNGLSDGSRVEAEGVVQGGVLVASKVERKDLPNSGSVRLFGTPSSVDTAKDSLTINGVVVSYATATLETGRSESALASTSLEVRGALDATGNLVVATRIKPAIKKACAWGSNARLPCR